MSPITDPYEIARRVRAAVAYKGMSRDEAAAVLGVSVPTYQRLTRTTGDPPRTRVDLQDLWRLAEACSLPREWFSACFGRLHLAVVDGPTFTPREDPREQLRGELEDRAARGRRSPPPGRSDGA